MVFPCGSALVSVHQMGTGVGGCKGISVGVAVGNPATGIVVVDGVHAANNKIQRIIGKKQIFIFPYSQTFLCDTPSASRGQFAGYPVVSGA